MTGGPGQGDEVDRNLERLPAHLQAQMRKLWHAEEWEGLSREERLHLKRWIIELIESDLREAMEIETFGMRGEEHMSRTVSLVDERGWREINRIQDDALLAILAAKTESAERLAEDDKPGMSMLSAMLSCELAERPAADA